MLLCVTRLLLPGIERCYNVLPGYCYQVTVTRCYYVLPANCYQVLGLDEALPSTPHITPRNTETDLLAAAQSGSSTNNTEKWLRRRTKLKVNNLNPNHRCFDTIYLEGQEQEIFAKFFYGPLDALSLVGEKVGQF